MCIIAVKNKGIHMPSDDIICNMWYSNPHGAGIMWVENNEVYIKKGFMELNGFLDFIHSFSKERNTVDIPIVMHFRITTHGGTKPENCHPFPITESMNELTALEIKTNMGIAHNGIISCVNPREGISDTMEYISTNLYELYNIYNDFYKSERILGDIYKVISSKMAILTSDGRISLIGDFTTNSDGCLYSNRSYQSYRSYFATYQKPSVSKTRATLIPFSLTEGYVINNFGEELFQTNFYIDKSWNVYEYDELLDEYNCMDEYVAVSWSDWYSDDSLYQEISSMCCF